MGEAKQFTKNIKFKHFPGIDEIIDEKGSMYIALRRTVWYNPEQGDADEKKAKLELRKWMVKDSNSENDMPQKGVSFLTEEGPHNLATALVRNGFGKTKELLLELKERPDFKDSVQHMYEGDDMDSEEFFDARAELLEA